MKSILAILLSFFLLSIQGEEFKGNIKTDSFEQAKKHQSQLKFIVESTKVGLFSSDVDGYVKEFDYTADLDKTNMIVRNIVVTFKVTSMDTDGEGRDEKLHNLCLSHNDHPIITITIPGAIFLKDARPQKMQGTVNIRGKDKNFEIEFNKKLEDNKFSLTGKTLWSLKGMEIPDPSIAVAKLSDEIEIEVKFHSNLN